MFNMRAKALGFAVSVVGALVVVNGCRAGGYTPPTSVQQQSLQVSKELHRILSPDVSVLKQLDKQVVIGSTVDPWNGAQNPYGLTIAPITAGKMKAGDLVVCNFNANSNVQGTGESIVALHPVPGSKPTHISFLEPLHGCDALALDVDDTIWASTMTANDNPVIDPTGKHLIANLSGKPFNQPWGQVLARRKSASAFYETNAGTGSVVRINGSTFAFEVLATGFPVNHGVPGTALAPSGLAYDAKIDTLYFADGMNNTIVAFKDVSKYPKGAIKAIDHGMKFSGPWASHARIVFAGTPLNGPISTALLPNGSLVVGNTLDPTGKNLLIELSAGGKVLDVRNVDKGTAGALFGLVVTGTTISNTKVYFNDDNANEVEVLEH